MAIFINIRYADGTGALTQCEARNAYMGTGIDRNNRIARELDKMRAKVAQWAHDETRRAVK